MGAWGAGCLENDDASDFLADLADAGDWAVAEAAFDRVLSVSDDYLEAPDSSAGIGAAAVTAHKTGGLPLDIEFEYKAAIEALTEPDAGLVAKARAALARIKQQSELGDLWEEAGRKAEWLATIDEVEQAL
jgi:hypothetical protein